MLSRLRQSTNRDDKGFTLIELLVVMIIIGILAAIAIPVFLSQRSRAYESAIKADLNRAATEVETAYVDNQTYPADDGAFQALLTANNILGTDGVTLEYTAVTGGFCIDGTHTADSRDFSFNNTAGGISAPDILCP